MNRFASTRSEKRASHPCAGRAQCSVGSIDDDGIRYGLTTNALIRRTIATAPAIVTTQSTIVRHGCGRRRASLSTGLCECCSATAGGGHGDSTRGPDRRRRSAPVAGSGVGRLRAAARRRARSREQHPGRADRERDPEDVQASEDVAEAVAEEAHHVPGEDADVGSGLLQLVLDEEREARSTCRSGCRASAQHDADRLARRRSARRRGRSPSPTAAPDAPGEDAELAARQLGDVAPDDAGDERREQPSHDRACDAVRGLRLARRRAGSAPRGEPQSSRSSRCAGSSAGARAA